MPAGPAAARPLPGAAAEAAGGGLRAVPHDRSRGVLQPRGSVDRRERGRHDRAAASRRTQTMEPNFVLMTLPGETDDGVRRDPAVHAGQPQQPDRLDRRAQRRRALRHGDRLRLPEDAAGRRPAAGRGAHRSERAAVRAAVAVEPAGIARPARQPARHSDRPRAALRRADLPAGRAQPDAGAAARRARAAGSAGVRADVRIGARRRSSADSASTHAGRGRARRRRRRRSRRRDRRRAAAEPGRRPQRRSSPTPRAISPTTSG